MLKKEVKLGKNAFAVAGLCAVMVAGVCNVGLTQAYADDAAPGVVAPAGEDDPEQEFNKARDEAINAILDASEEAENTINALNLDADAKQEALYQVQDATQTATAMVWSQLNVLELKTVESNAITQISQIVSDAKAKAAGENPHQEDPANPGVPGEKPEVGPGPVKPEDKTPGQTEDKKESDKKMSKDAKKSKIPATSDSAFIGSAAVISAIGSAMAVLGIKSKND